MKKPSMLASLALVFLPWYFKRMVLVHIYGNVIHKNAYIGMSFLAVKHMQLGDDTRIGHLNVVKGLESMVLGQAARIGNLNWITGFPMNSNTEHFNHVINRFPSLNVEEHAAITNRHLIDCTDRVSVGAYATLAGFRSQILTHSIDAYQCRQDSKPVVVGDYCFIGTSVVLLPGSVVPDHSLVSAGAVVTGVLDQSWSMYGGVPAKFLKSIPLDSKYFSRDIGRVI